MPRNDLNRPPALEGADPDPEADDLLSASGPAEVSQEAALEAITDMIGSGNTGRVHAKRVLESFARKGWRIIADR